MYSYNNLWYLLCGKNAKKIKNCFLFITILSFLFVWFETDPLTFVVQNPTLRYSTLLRCIFTKNHASQSIVIKPTILHMVCKLIERIIDSSSSIHTLCQDGMKSFSILLWDQKFDSDFCRTQYAMEVCPSHTTKYHPFWLACRPSKDRGAGTIHTKSVII